jgi:hypothetical protein
MADRWVPASHDDVDGARRRDAAERDVALHITRAPCPGCGAKARLSGGEGCRCRTDIKALQARCDAHSERMARWR